MTEFVEELTRRQFGMKIGSVCGAVIVGTSVVGPRTFGDESEVSYRPDIRVALSDLPVSSSMIQSDANFKVRLPDGGTLLGEIDATTPVNVEPSETGIRIGPRVFKASRIELTAPAAAGFRTGGHRYRGRLQIVRQPSSRIRLINVLRMDDYLASVIDSEMPFSFGVQARTAQAIVARTYALYHMQRRHPLFDVFASTRSQAYLGWQYRTAAGRLLAGESQASREIVDQTAGMVLTFDGKLMCSYFSACCGSRSRSGVDVFGESGKGIDAVACDWCKPAPLYSWSRSVSRDSFLTTLNRKRKTAMKRPVRGDFTIDENQAPMFGKSISIADGIGKSLVDRRTVQLHYFANPLPSPLFTLSANDTMVTADGSGHGHGVGLCQWGAKGLGADKKTATEIISHYYPRARLIRMTAES